MTTSLEAITKKAASDKGYRFQDLYGMLNESYLLGCWRGINKKSAVGVDGISAKAYEGNLEANVRDLVARYNPAIAPQLQAVNQGWANLVQIERAGSSLGASLVLAALFLFLLESILALAFSTYR